MRSIALLLLLLGIILITLGISKNSTSACPQNTETRTVSNTYMNDILSTDNNYKHIFTDTNLGIPDSELGFVDNNDDESNTSLHNFL